MSRWSVRTLLFHVLQLKFLHSMSPALSSLKPMEVIGVLQKLGFIEMRQSGSHKIFRHSENKRIIPVPIHGHRDIKKGTLHSIIKQSGVTRDEFIALLKR